MAPLFDATADVSKYIPEFQPEIIDVSHIPDDTIRGEIVLRVLFLIEKYIQTPQLFEKMDEIFKILTDLASDSRKTKYVETVLRYLAATVEKENKQKLKDELLKVFKKGDSIMATIAEEWVKEGKIEGKEEDAKKMAEFGMTDEVIHHVTGLPLERIAEIRRALKI
jgi:predicted transposase/invertase (TIGR01784 family)